MGCANTGSGTSTKFHSGPEPEQTCTDFYKKKYNLTDKKLIFINELKCFNRLLMRITIVVTLTISILQYFKY